MLDKSGKLNCEDDHYMKFCCGTCRSLSQQGNGKPPSSEITTTKPLAFKSLPPGYTSTPSHHRCTDKEGQEKCEELARYNKLNCDELDDVARCCATCNAIIDYLETMISHKA
ncbi:unnamed protein product [Strongylus vulgaris]|uniref:Uncharacterized protein n=1 Tax=Strongylus vulgaris TaxID=40348 RepID=A0A3P7III5_STRVU|nr:unnamed protein product [Strongylus vulgaris]